MHKVLDTPEFKKRFEQGKKARSHGSLHTGGSIPVAMHHRNLAEKLAKKGGIPLQSVSSMFLSIRTIGGRTGATWTRRPARLLLCRLRAPLQDVVEESVAESSPATTSSSIAARTNDLFVQATGGRGKGGRVYGTGSLASQMSVFSRPPPPASSAATQPDRIEQIVTTMSTLQATVVGMHESISSMKASMEHGSSGVLAPPVVVPRTTTSGPSGASAPPAAASGPILSANAVMRLLSLLPPEAISSIPAELVNEIPSDVLERMCDRGTPPDR